jgi:transglutaminase-like putative cysteine protease
MRKSYAVVFGFVLFFSLSFATSLFFTDTALMRKNTLKKYLDFTFSYEEAKAIIQTYYPELSIDKDVMDFIETRNIQRLETNEGFSFFMNFEENLFYRDPELRKRFPEQTESTKFFVSGVLEEFASPDYLTDQFKDRFCSLYKPRTYFVEYTISVPKKELPESGFLKLWIPLPLLIPSQQEITFLDIQPQSAVIGYPVIDGDIAYLHMRFNMEDVIETLEIRLVYTYQRYQQHFAIEENKVGAYDTQSPLYKTYTQSRGSTVYDERFRELALKIVGEETSVYRQAKKIYDYIIDNIRYSFMAYNYLEASEIPVSVFVLENGYGDCGSQSMFFSALCRSIGIPARTTGGFQIFGEQLGPHFWAEFFLPNYGWVPVDTSAAQIATYTTGITENQRRAFKEYFFGNLDPLRLTVQNDVNLYPATKPEDIQYLSTVLQHPYIDSEKGNFFFGVSFAILSRVETRIRMTQ